MKCRIDDNKKVVLGDYDIRGVIFDIDGVLLDSLGIWKDLGARYLIRQGKEPESGLSETLFSMSMEEGARYLKEHYLPDLSETKISEGLENMLRDFYYYEVWAKPGAEALLKACRDAGLRVTAATSSPRSHIERALYRNGLLGYIERIYTNAEVGFSKHSPEIYDRAAAGMGFEREQVCVLEDSLYALKTAAAAGYYTVGVYDENGEPDQKGLEETADIYVRELQDLLKLIQ
jgi:HAD superfamily hydrolase (TIGR01509 family)